MTDVPKNILVFRTGQLGDSLIALPAIDAIRRRHAGYRMVLLTEQQPVAGWISAWDVFGPTRWFDEVLFYRPAMNFWRRLATLLSVTWRLRRRHFQIVYDLAPERTLQQSRRDLFFFRYLCGIHDYRGGGYLAKPAKNQQGVLPRIEPEWRRLLRAADASGETTAFGLQIPDIDRHAARQALAALGIGASTPIVAIGPGSKMPAKRWPRERFRDVGTQLLQKYPELHLVVVGGIEDSDLGHELCRQWGERAHNLAGQLTPYASAAVLQHCVAYVGNDTGAMHLAGMVGTPCVALFSARDYPGQWEPYGRGHVVLRHETDCAGCMLEICPYENKCLALIARDEVIVALESIVDAGAVSKRRTR